MKTSFFQNSASIYVLQHSQDFKSQEEEKLSWLLNAQPLKKSELEGPFIGPRQEMVTPWSTNAVEIAANSGVQGIHRIERFLPRDEVKNPDPMLQQSYAKLDSQTLDIDREPEKIEHIDNIRDYNEKVGLALSPDEIEYLEKYVEEKGRPLTDSELFGFAQVNSEHCRHKIFNGKMIINGEEKEKSLFQWIKETVKQNPNTVVTNYNDNVAFVEGVEAKSFQPERGDVPSYFEERSIQTVLSLKAETHNFPTTVEPFNGAATGSGGEIRDRMAGGKGSLPLAGTACYMTANPRLLNQDWDKKVQERPWLYQTPQEILTKASNGASDFGNKFGQPLINGSLYTFESSDGGETTGFDKTIMLAGGIGYANERDAQKDLPKKGDKIILLGGDNYRIGMGGGAVSSLDTGEADKKLELNAVQRSNPEMQKRAYNAIRTLCESTVNPIVLIHDHGAGGHMNCLSELVEGPGGVIEISQLPVGDPSLSEKEIIGNESQERMGLVVKEEDVALLQAIADRERAPMYVIGEVTGDEMFICRSGNGEKPVDVELEFLFGKPPKTIIKSEDVPREYSEVKCTSQDFGENLKKVLQLEGVACKDWLTNKVDRSVTGRVGQQQCVGPLQLPLHGAGVMAIDFQGESGIATAMGHQPAAALIDSEKGSVISIAESLTNLIFVPIKDGLKSVTLSANWMWPCKAPGEDARLYKAVQKASEFAIDLGINISTGKDSLSMTQKYDSGEVVKAPGTVIISAMGPCENISKIVTPDLKPVDDSRILYVNFSGTDDCPLGGSALAQTQGVLGVHSPTVVDAKQFAGLFDTIQNLVQSQTLLAGHDISSGGMVTTALEMGFAGDMGISLSFEKDLNENELASFLFCEKPGLVIQIKSGDVKIVKQKLSSAGADVFEIGTVLPSSKDIILNGSFKYQSNIDELRKLWFEPSYQLEKHQTPSKLAQSRFDTFDQNPLRYKFPENFSGVKTEETPDSKLKAAIIREKGTNGEREMAYSLYAAGFDVKDVTMTDITEGRETLDDIHFIVFCGGFSNSDVLGSAKGWAGVFKYNPTAADTLKRFYARPDTLSLGVCNGCQLMNILGLVDSESDIELQHNESGKFESSFLQVDITSDTNSILLDGLKGSSLGIWVAHGEGNFALPKNGGEYSVAMKYSNSSYPSNPNGSDLNAAGIVSKDGRHLAMMPHLERSIFPWQWAYYPEEYKGKHKVTPWLHAFVSGRKWLESQVSEAVTTT